MMSQNSVISLTYDDKSKNKVFFLLIIICWLLSLSSLHPAGQTAPVPLGVLDWLSFIKIGGRALAFLLIAIVLIMRRNIFGQSYIIQRLFPLALFALWAIISTMWSPLKVLSLTHGIELLMLVMLSAASASCCEKQHFSPLFLNVSLILLIMTSVSLILYYKFPETRYGYFVDRPFGLGHPNDIASSAGLCTMIVILCSLLWNWSWSRILIIPTLIIGSWFLIVARSRYALVETIAAIVAILWIFRKRFVIICIILCLSLIATGIVTTDLSTDAFIAVHTHILRGQDKHEISDLSGRWELWQDLFNYFIVHSPLLGNGYFVTLPTSGFVEVEHEERPTFGAHNLLLQVLTGTGIVGGILFIWGICRVLAPLIRNIFLRSEQNSLTIVASFIVIWFLGQGVFEVSFLSAIRPSIIIFFVVLGIVARHL
jgi:O-antigen ligase